MAPASGVEDRPGELVQAGDRRHLRDRELAACGDQDVRLGRPGAGLERPALPILVPFSSQDLDAGADRVEHTVAAGHVLDVLLDLRLRRVAARPARVRLEGELVQVRGNIACRTGVGVVLPDPAESLALLEDRDVPIAGAPQQDGGADSAEASADDGHRERLSPGARTAAVDVAVVEMPLLAHAPKVTHRRTAGEPAGRSSSRGRSMRENARVIASQPPLESS